MGGGRLGSPLGVEGQSQWSMSCSKLQHSILATRLRLPGVMFWLLGRSQGFYPLSLQPAIVGLFFPLFMVCDHCQQFFFLRSAFKYATFVLLYVDAGRTVMINQVLGALWGKC